MKNLTLSVFLLVLFMTGVVPSGSFAKIVPEENAKLNYRIIGFSFPQMQGCTGSYVQIEKGTITDPALFTPAITSPVTKGSRLISEVPEFGADYTWRVMYKFSNNKIVEGALFHFSTASMPLVSNRKMRLNVVEKNQKCNNLYLLVGGTNTMYDVDGNPVWFLPQITGMAMASLDMKCTPQNTITMFYGADIYEVDYSGQVKWKKSSVATSQDPMFPPHSVTSFHHEFSRLSNGHYMSWGRTQVPGPGNNEMPKSDSGRRRFFNPGMGEDLLYEFDETGKLVWSWNSMNYVLNSDIGACYRFVTSKLNMIFENHENSFYFDEKNQVIYLNYVGYNRIIKISYPSGKVLNTYGVAFDSATALKAMTDHPLSQIDVINLVQGKLFANPFFSGIHNCQLTRDGNLLMYNNMLGTQQPPSVLVLKETGKDGIAGLQKVWEFTCPVHDTNTTNTGGGGVYETPSGLMVVTMNQPYTEIFIVGRDKKILWSAIPERLELDQWTAFSLYRSSVVDRDQLEQLIWAGEGIDTTDSKDRVITYKTTRP